jgi:hypothetical protein
MPTFQITVHNEDFTSSDEHECVDKPEALKQGIKAPIAIVTDQVSSGKPFFGAEILLEEGNKKIARYVVAVGASPLKSDG